MEIQAGARPMNLYKEGDEVLEGPSKPIHRPRGDHVELAARCALEHAVEGWALVAAIGPC